MPNSTTSTRLHDFFLAMARKSFSELGLPDEAVVRYVAGLLTDFAHRDRLYTLKTEKGTAVESVVSMLVESQRQPSEQHNLFHTREMRKYVGDYTLFMSGLFRTHVERSGVLDYYLAEGRRSYWAVSELDLTLYRTGFLFFQQLSRNFEYYSGALDYMRKAYFTPEAGNSPFAAFLKHVEGWISSGGISDN